MNKYENVPDRHSQPDATAQNQTHVLILSFCVC